MPSSTRHRESSETKNGAGESLRCVSVVSGVQYAPTHGDHDDSRSRVIGAKVCGVCAETRKGPRRDSRLGSADGGNHASAMRILAVASSRGVPIGRHGADSGRSVSAWRPRRSTGHVGTRSTNVATLCRVGRDVDSRTSVGLTGGVMSGWNCSKCHERTNVQARFARPVARRGRAPVGWYGYLRSCPMSNHLTINMRR